MKLCFAHETAEKIGHMDRKMLIVFLYFPSQIKTSPFRYPRHSASSVPSQALVLSKGIKMCNGCIWRKYAFPGRSFSSLQRFSLQDCLPSVPIHRHLLRKHSMERGLLFRIMYTHINMDFPLANVVIDQIMNDVNHCEQLSFNLY